MTLDAHIRRLGLEKTRRDLVRTKKHTAHEHNPDHLQTGEWPLLSKETLTILFSFWQELLQSGKLKYKVGIEEIFLHESKDGTDSYDLIVDLSGRVISIIPLKSSEAKVLGFVIAVPVWKGNPFDQNVGGVAAPQEYELITKLNIPKKVSNLIITKDTKGGVLKVEQHLFTEPAVYN
jgi:hypothetical protein